MSRKQNIKAIIDNHKNFILAVAVNISFFLLVFLLNGFQYELSDDWFFSVNIAKGNYDFTFCSYFIQLISGILQKIVYPLNAFMLLQLILGFMAMTSIAYVFLDTFGNKKGILFVLLVESAFAFNIYSLITFTKTAAVLITAGGLMIFWAHCRKRSLAYSVFGMMMALLGSFYRFQIFYSVFVVLAFSVFAYLIYQAKTPGMKGFLEGCRDFFQIKTVSILLILIITVFSFNSASRMILFSNEELDYYREYNSLRSSVVDFQLPSYEEEMETYEALGVSENDIEMLRNWYIDDQGLATIDTLTEISKLQEGRQTQTNFLMNMIKSFVGLAELLLLIIYLFTVLGILTTYKKKAWLFVGFITFAVGLLYGYLFAIGRCNYRSVFSIWFAATVCLLYSVSFLKTREWILRKNHFFRKCSVPVCVLFCIFFFVFGNFYASPSLTRRAGNDFPGLGSYITSSKDKTFALGRTPYLLYRNVKQFDNAMVFTKNEAFEQCVYFGSPYYAHPSYNQLLESKGIDNLYTALAERDDLYFVDSVFPDYTDIDEMITYLNEWYGEEKYYDYVLVHEVEEFNIYQIVGINKE